MIRPSPSPFSTFNFGFDFDFDFNIDINIDFDIHVLFVCLFVCLFQRKEHVGQGREEKDARSWLDLFIK